MIPDSIPKFRRNLPFIYQPRSLAFQECRYIQIGHFKICFLRVRIGHIKSTLRKCLTCCGLPAPLCTLHQNGTHTMQFSRQQGINNSLFIVFHGAIIPYSTTRYNSVREFVDFSFGSLRTFRSGVCGLFVREFVLHINSHLIASTRSGRHISRHRSPCQMRGGCGRRTSWESSARRDLPLNAARCSRRS